MGYSCLDEQKGLVTVKWRMYKKNREPGIAAHVCISAFQEADTRGLKVPSQPGKLRDLARPCLQSKKYKKGAGDVAPCKGPGFNPYYR